MAHTPSKWSGARKAHSAADIRCRKRHDTFFRQPRQRHGHGSDRGRQKAGQFKISAREDDTRGAGIASRAGIAGSVDPASAATAPTPTFTAPATAAVVVAPPAMVGNPDTTRPPAQLEGISRRRAPSGSASLILRGVLFLLLATSFLAAVHWISRLVPETSYVLASDGQALILAVVFHALTAVLVIRLFLEPSPDLPPLLNWLWLTVGMAGAGWCRGSGAAYGAACAVVVAALMTFAFRCLNRRRTGQERRFAIVVGAALLLSAYGLVVMAGASMRQLAAQVLWFCLSWLMVAHPWTGLALGRLLRAPCRPAVRGWSLFIMGALLMLGNIGYKWATRTPYPSVQIAGFSCQPFLLAFFLFLLAEPLLRSRGNADKGSNADNSGDTIRRALGVTVFFLALGESGTLAIYWLVLGLYICIAIGPCSRSLRQVGSMGLVLLLLGLTVAYVPASGRRFAHVRERVNHLGGTPQAELVRVDAAVTHGGLLGRMGAARVWMISREAAKDYSIAILVINTGFLGLGFVLLLYAAMLGGLFDISLRVSHSPLVRHTAILLTLILCVQALLPLLGHAHSFIAMGIPALGIGRGGSYFFCFALSLALVAAAGQMQQTTTEGGIA